MGKKIFLIILSITLFVGVVFVVFLNSRIIKGDANTLGAPHYLKVSIFEDINLENSKKDAVLLINEEIGIAKNGKMYNCFVEMPIFNAYNNNIHFSLLMYFNLPSDIVNGDKITDYISYIEFGYYPYNFNELFVEIDGFNGEISFSTNYIIVAKGSYFVFKMTSYNILKIIDITAIRLEGQKPDFDHFENGYDVGDIAMLLADLFYLYPQWLISHVSFPLRMFGGVFNW